MKYLLDKILVYTNQDRNYFYLVEAKSIQIIRWATVTINTPVFARNTRLVIVIVW